MFMCDLYSFIQKVSVRHNIISGRLLKKIIVCQTFTDPLLFDKYFWFSVSVCLTVVAELKHWGAGQFLTIWQWHCTYARFNIADGRHMCSTCSQNMFDTNWGGWWTALWSKTRGCSWPCSTHSQLIKNCPAWRHSVLWIKACSDKVIKLTKAGIKNL